MDAWTTGLGARAWAAHKNAHEAIGMYGPAAVASLALSAPALPAATLGAAVLVARVGHALCALAAWDTARSVAWGVFFCAAVGTYGLCLWPTATVKALGLA